MELEAQIQESKKKDQEKNKEKEKEKKEGKQKKGKNEKTRKGVNTLMWTKWAGGTEPEEMPGGGLVGGE